MKLVIRATVAALLLCAPSTLSAQGSVGSALESPYVERDIGSFAMRWRQSFTVPIWASTHVGTSFWWSGTDIDPLHHFWIAYVSRDPELNVNTSVINSRPAGWLGVGSVGAVTPGETIYLWLAGNNGVGDENVTMPQIRITEYDTYPTGTLEAFHVPQVGDMHFKAYFTVPEPSVFLLLLGGLVSLVVAGRRRDTL